MALYGYVHDSNGWIDVLGLNGIIKSSSFSTIDLTQPNWKNINFNGNQKGIVYILKDVETGEFLKVGKTEVDKYKGRFSKYVTAGNKTNRKLEIDLFTVDKNNLDSIESIEKSIRNNLEKLGYSLPWDNTNNRLNRIGPGVPFTRLSKNHRQQFEWDMNGELKLKKSH